MYVFGCGQGEEITMKLCIAYPNRNSYSETFIHNHLSYLKPEITLTGGWRPYITKEGENIISIPAGELIRIGIKRVFSVLYPPFYTYFLTKYLQKEKPDVVLAEYGITGLGVMEACKKTNTRLVVHFHGFDASHRPTIEKYKKDYQRLFEIADKIIVVSKDMAAQLMGMGAPAAKIINNPYGVETEKFYGANPQQAEKIVLSVGRFTGKKAPHLTLQAFDKVLEKHPDARLVMIGGGELFESSKALVETLGMKHAVEFAGVKSPEEVAEWHRKARIFVQHSITNPENGDSEGTPNTILEASAAGLPIISTRHAGIKEAVDHEITGFLVEEGDYLKMADYMCLLLDDSALAQKMGENAALKMRQEYEIELRIDRLRQILQRDTQ
jgi:colanic acid/amylovoran biosynthesis glycosyltransferase